MTLFYTCKKCNFEIELEVTPIIPAVTSGPTECCSPEEGGEVDYEYCPYCSSPIPEEEVREIVRNMNK